MKKKSSRSNPLPNAPQNGAAPSPGTRQTARAPLAAGLPADTPAGAKAAQAAKPAKTAKAVKTAKTAKPAKAVKTPKRAKAGNAPQADAGYVSATPALPQRNAPRVSLYDGLKTVPVTAQTLQIEFAGGRTLHFDLSGEAGEAAIAVVAQHADPQQRATLLVRPEHFDSLTLHVFTEQLPEDLDDILHIAGDDAFDDELDAHRKRPAVHNEDLVLDLSVQYGDEIGGTQRKTLPKRKLIAEWLGHSLFGNAALTVRFVGAKEGRALNEQYRHKDYPTNVLTFSYGDLPDGTLSSDLVLCCPVVEKEAREQGKPLIAHYAHLLVHGALHAQGYDHELGEADAAEMEALEIEILDLLGFPNPYV